MEFALTCLWRVHIPVGAAMVVTGLVVKTLWRSEKGGRWGRTWLDLGRLMGLFTLIALGLVEAMDFMFGPVVVWPPKTIPTRLLAFVAALLQPFVMTPFLSLVRGLGRRNWTPGAWVTGILLMILYAGLAVTAWLRSVAPDVLG